MRTRWRNERPERRAINFASCSELGHVLTLGAGFEFSINYQRMNRPSLRSMAMSVYRAPFSLKDKPKGFVFFRPFQVVFSCFVVGLPPEAFKVSRNNLPVR